MSNYKPYEMSGMKDLMKFAYGLGGGIQKRGNCSPLLWKGLLRWVERMKVGGIDSLFPIVK